MKRHDSHRHQIVRTSAGYLIEGIAHVTAAPHRRSQDAHALARRIARSPRAYLAAARIVALPGITDLRFGEGSTFKLAV
jgi:hypothetical protein